MPHHTKYVTEEGTRGHLSRSACHSRSYEGEEELQQQHSHTVRRSEKKNEPEAEKRRQQSYAVRQSASALAAARPHPEHHIANLDERRHRNYNFLASFTKGLPHDIRTGLLDDTSHYHLFINAANTGSFSDISQLPLGPPKRNHTSRRLFLSGISRTPAVSVRAWDSMAAGTDFDLQGPDAQACTMPPAPSLKSVEMASEMCELYWMALIRDVPFSEFQSSKLVRKAVHSMNRQKWIRCAPSKKHTEFQHRRRRGPFSFMNIFRGITRGDDTGPYISQFLLMGTMGVNRDTDPSFGYVQYGAVRIDQRVRVAARLDYMTSWGAWIDVQNGADVRGRGSFEAVGLGNVEEVGSGDGGYRFITTPRDLATYVHFDASYQAYHTACLMLLDMGVPFDSGIPFQGPDSEDKQTGFVTFGGPHILSLVAEVASRALKAVCHQKFNVHRRLRPEAVGGLLEKFRNEAECETLNEAVRHLHRTIDDDVLNQIESLNKTYNSTVKDRGWPRDMDYDPFGDCGKTCEGRGTVLLPQAYPEGSPMHPSYGAGHAVVAGACTTVLKAFFECTFMLPSIFVPTEDGRYLMDVGSPNSNESVIGSGGDGVGLTVEGELNKLCSNIAIGRNWAGVHYFSDYYESILLGEKVAVGLLEEQKLTFREEFSMAVPLFDGSYIQI